MTFRRLLHAGCCLVLLSVPSAAQNPPASDDPFGGSGAGPFRDSAKADPFGGGPVTDPFGGTSNADPFGGPAEADPFGADPFAGSPDRKAARRAPTAGGHAAAGRPSEVENHIRNLLSGPTQVNAVELPLADLVVTLSRQHDVPILIDQQSLEEIGISHETPISLQVKNVSLRSCLRLVLRPLDLTYMVKDEVLQITTQQTAERNLVLQTYRLPDLLTGKEDKVIEVLTATVQPDQWECHGGTASAATIDSVLVVSATETGHEAVQEFIEKVHLAAQQRQAGSAGNGRP